MATMIKSFKTIKQEQSTKYINNVLDLYRYNF